MTTIWKFPIKTTDVQRIMLPKDAVILTVQTQNEGPCLWAQFELSNKENFEERVITIHGTGHVIADLTDNKTRVYIGTYQIERGSECLCNITFVFHVFEIKEKKKK